MKIYDTLQDYKNNAKIGDFIALEGSGLISGFAVESKNDLYKVVSLNSQSGFVQFKKYRGRTKFTVSCEQRVGVIDKKQYSLLKDY